MRLNFLKTSDLLPIVGLTSLLLPVLPFNLIIFYERVIRFILTVRLLALHTRVLQNMSPFLRGDPTAQKVGITADVLQKLCGRPHSI